MPSSSRDFQRAARQRLTTAEFLLQHRYNLDAMYLGGYTVECALKALILELTSAADRAAMLQRISSGKQMHEAEILAAILKELGCAIPLGDGKLQMQRGEVVLVKRSLGRSNVVAHGSDVRTESQRWPIILRLRSVRSYID